MKFNWKTRRLLITISLMLGLASCKKIEVTELKITSPTEDQPIESTPLPVEGTVKTSDDKAFLNHYTICLYKEVDNGFYWQENSGNVTIIGTKWQGKVWPQNEFKPGEIQTDKQGQKFKKEGVRAIVCSREKDKQKELPGYNVPDKPIAEGHQDLDAYFQKELSNIEGQKESLTTNFKNMLPSQQSE